MKYALLVALILGMGYSLPTPVLADSNCANCPHPEPDDDDPPDDDDWPTNDDDPLPPDDPPGRPCDDDGNGNEVGTGSIHMHRAEKRRQVTDLRTYGAAPIAFTRHYNSRTTDFTTNYFDFGWKQTWQHNWNYEMRDLQSKTHGQNDVKLRLPSGNEFNFYAADSNGVVRVPLAFQGDRLYKWSGTPVGHTLVKPNGWEYDFQRTTSPRYQLIRVRDGKGLAWTLSYNAQGKLERIANNFGRWIEIERGTTNGAYCITAVRSSDGREVAYRYGTWEYDALSTSVVVTTTNVWMDPPGEWVVQTNYTPVVATNHVADAVLDGVDYPDATQAEYTYAGALAEDMGRPLLAAAVDPCHPGAGARVRYEYNYDFIFDFGEGPYLVTGVVLEERNLDTDSMVVRLPTGAGDSPLIEMGGVEGGSYGNMYDCGLKNGSRDAEGRETTYTHDQGGAGFMDSKTDPLGNITTYERDYAGRVTSVSNPNGETKQATYNSSGFPLTRVDALSRTTVYTRATNNFLMRMDYPDGSFEAWTRNEYGQALTHTLRCGGVESFSYYGTNETGGLYGDLKIRTDPASNTTVYAWTVAGLLSGIVDARGNAVHFSYDWRGNLLARTNADNTATFHQYDAFANRTNMANELGHETAFTFDEFNRLKTVTDPLGRVTEYEYGRAPGCGGCGGHAPIVSRIIHPDGKRTEYAYDLTDRRTNETIAAGTAEAATTVWTYDGAGRLATQTDANGNKHTWVYDAGSRVVAETNAAGDVTTYAYDVTGKLTNRVDGAGVETFWEYDAMNRVTAIGSGTLRYEYEYDLAGRRTAMHTRVNGDIAETTTYVYDELDRLIEKIDPTGYSLTYGYDAVGNRTNLTVARVEGGRVYLSQSYAYDERNRLASMIGNDRVTAFQYDALGRRTNAVWPNETTATYAYDDANQLLSLVHASAATTIASFVYGYDLGGNRTNMITLEGTNSYAYDNRDWLTYAEYPDGSSQDFDYDPVGNRTVLTEVGTGVPPVRVTAYTYGPANRLLASASALETNVYAYDGAGRLTNQLVNGQERRYEYSFRGQMTALHDMDGRVFAYAFDGDGNRVSQGLNDCLETRFVYDGANVVLDLISGTEIVHAYINGRGMDQPIERIAFVSGDARQRHVYHTDALGSVAVMTDDSVTAAKTYAYEAFGRIRAETGALVVNRHTFTGREAMADLRGWYYFRWRVVDPISGRFASEDPLGFVDGPLRYGYVGGNPVSLVDPLGLAPDSQDTFSSCMTRCMFGPPTGGPATDIITEACSLQWPKAGGPIAAGGAAISAISFGYCLVKCSWERPTPPSFKVWDTLYPPSTGAPPGHWPFGT